MFDPRKNVMTCPQCGAPPSCKNSSIETQHETENDFLRCDHCEALYFPQPNAEGIRVLGVPSDFSCPQCRTQQLVHASVGGERVFYCEVCHGLLIRIRVFPDVVSQVAEQMRLHHLTSEYPGKQPDWDQLKRLVKCPLCDAPMDAHPYAGPGAVIIDSCSDCCVNWLDRGELQRIVREPDHHFSVSLVDV